MQINQKVNVLKCGENGWFPIIQNGVITGLTTAGAFIWDAGGEHNKRPDCAEWFAFRSDRIQIQVV